MHKRFGLFIILFLTLITSSVCVEKFLLTGSLFPWQDSKKPITEIKIGLLPIEESLPFLVAQEKGYFSQKGLPARLIFFSSSMELNRALAAKRIDGMVGDIIGAAQLEEEGTDTAIVSLCLGAKAQEGRFAILAAPNSGIKSVRELAGVPIAIANNSLSEYVTENILAQHKIPPQKRKEVIIRPLAMRLKMLVNGQVKAATLPDPLAASAREEGAILLADDTQGDNISQSVLLFRQDVLNQRSKDIKKFMQSYASAVKNLNGQEEQDRELLVRKGIIPSNVDNTYKVNQFSALQLPSKGDIEKVLNWMKSRGIVSSEITYDKLVSTEFCPKKKLFGFGENK